jgi:protocatechuate 4,5-dioxygenase beta chain
LLNWVIARSALQGEVILKHSNYHIPISNTAAGLMLMESV